MRYYYKIIEHIDSAWIDEPIVRFFAHREVQNLDALFKEYLRVACPKTADGELYLFNNNSFCEWLIAEKGFVRVPIKDEIYPQNYSAIVSSYE